MDFQGVGFIFAGGNSRDPVDRVIVKTNARSSKMTVRSLTTPLGSSSRESPTTFCYANFSNSSEPFPFKIVANLTESKLRLFVPGENGEWKPCLELSRLTNYIGQSAYLTAMGFAGMEVRTSLELNGLRLYENRSEKAEAKLLNELLESGKKDGEHRKTEGMNGTE